MDSIIEQLVRSFARRTTKNGEPVLHTNGHPALLAAFAQLGWSDPYPEIPPKPEPKVAKPAIDVTDLTSRGEYVAAVVTPDPERAVLPAPKGRSGVRS